MMDSACRQYFEDPDTHGTHLDHCAACAALFRPPAPAPPSPPALALDTLPLAPWEEAAYRPWPLAAGIVLAILTAAFALSSLAGLNPIELLRSAGATTSELRLFIASSAKSLGNAPMLAQIGFAALFIVVNAALVLMLRRPPRGVDA